MSLANSTSSVTRSIIIIRVVNRLAGFGMGFLGLRLAADLGVSLTHVGVLLAAFGLCTIPSRILGGVLASRYGPRTAIILGLIGCALSQLVIGLSTSVVAVVAGVLLLGLTYEIIEPATQGMLAENVPQERLSSTFALLWSTVSVAGVVAGGLAALILPYGVSALFVVDGASSLVAAVAAALLLPSTKPLPDARQSLRRAATGGLLGWTAIGSVYATLVMIVVFMLPLAVVASGQKASLTGWLLAVGAASALLSGRLLARLEQRAARSHILIGGHLLLALSVLCWVPGSVAGFVAGAALEGASAAILAGTYQAQASALSPAGQTTAAMAVFGLCWGIGTTAAPTVGALLLDHGPEPLWLSVAAGSLAMAGVHGVRRPHPIPVAA